MLIARPGPALEATADRARAAGATVTVEPLDLRDRQATGALAVRLAAAVPEATVLVHGAGVWPTRRELTADGLETAFVVDHLPALRLQEPLLAAGTPRQGAGRLRWADRARPRRSAAHALAVHPGVVRTELGAGTGLVARVARLVKRRWEDPVTCGGRLAPMLDEPDRWAPAGEAAWRFEAEPKPWPEKVTAPGTVAAVRAATAAVTA